MKKITHENSYIIPIDIRYQRLHDSQCVGREETGWTVENVMCWPV